MDSSDSSDLLSVSEAMSITTIRTFVVVVGFLFWCKIFRYMIEKEQKAKRVYHRTKPASKSKVRAIRFDLDLVEFINLQPNVSLFINDLIRREKEKIERMKAIEVREILKEME